MQSSLLQGPEGSFALSAQHLTEQQQQALAKSLSAMLCSRAGITNADPLMGNSRSNSPHMGPTDASASSGSLDTACMQLPPAAVPMHAGSCMLRPSPLGRPQHQQHGCNSHDQECSIHINSSMPTHDTPASLFKACRLGDPSCYGTPSTHSHEPAVAPGNNAAAGGSGPTVTMEPPVCPRSAAADDGAAAMQDASPDQQQHEAACGSYHAAVADAAHDYDVEAPAVQQRYRRPCVISSPKAWLYELVTCPFLFKPCPQCSANNSGREVLITYFDTDNPTQGYCTYCPQRHMKPHLLQIRRSTYHEVVKATDVSRLTDVSGIQHYIINGAKVLFLRPRPQPRPPKGVVAPARCSVDGRQLMDAHSSYCSLRCKLEVEDVVFAANFPSLAEEMQAATAAAGSGPDSSAGGLAGTYHRQGGHEGRRVVVPGHKRSTLQPQFTSAVTAAHSASTAPYDSSEDGGDAADGGWSARHKRHRHMPSKFANAVVGGSYQAAVGGGSRTVSGHHRPQQHPDSKARDDTACDQAAAAYTTSAGGTPVGLAGLAGLHLLHKSAAADTGGHHAGSPCGSDDSGRSTTCSQRNHKRKRAPPSRSALQ